MTDTRYFGICHCGKVAFEVEGLDLSTVPVHEFNGRDMRTRLTQRRNTGGGCGCK